MGPVAQQVRRGGTPGSPTSPLLLRGARTEPAWPPGHTKCPPAAIGRARTTRVPPVASAAERHGPGGPAGLQNLCGVVAPRSVGSTPAPLRQAESGVPTGLVKRLARRLRRSGLPLETAWGRLGRGGTVAGMWQNHDQCLACDGVPNSAPIRGDPRPAGYWTCRRASSLSERPSRGEEARSLAFLGPRRRRRSAAMSIRRDDRRRVPSR